MKGMKKYFWGLSLPVFLIITSFNSSKPADNPIVIVIHAGAGNMDLSHSKPETRKPVEDKLNEALELGHKVMVNGGTSTDAVEAAINVMENAGIFDAGKGAIFNSDGKVELDASIMQGKDLKAGSVAAVMTIKNPITAARAVMEKSTHVMLVARGAEDFAKAHGLEMVDNSYFYTPGAMNEWKSLKDKENQIRKSGQNFLPETNKWGTCGVVALDKYGNIAAGTSTGGVTYKKPGRVGDSPIIGAGTYADNTSCAVSCTGTGEYFIRLGVARDITNMIVYKGYSLQKAAAEALAKVKALGGEGGLIVLNKNGQFVMDFTTNAMNRGYIDQNGKKEIKIIR